MGKKNKTATIFFILAISLLLVIVSFRSYFYYLSFYPDPINSVSVYDINTYVNDNGELYRQFDKTDRAYKMAVNSKGKPIFVDTKKALSKFLDEYDEVLEIIKKEYHLKEMSNRNWKEYKLYGWQISSDELMRGQGYKVTQFFDIYENSFKD